MNPTTVLFGSLVVFYFLVTGWLPHLANIFSMSLKGNIPGTPAEQMHDRPEYTTPGETTQPGTPCLTCHDTPGTQTETGETEYSGGAKPYVYF